MKKLILMTALCLTLTACGSKAEPATTPTEAVTAVTETTAIPTTEAAEPETTAAEAIFLTVYSPSEDLEGFAMTQIQVDEINESIIMDNLILANVLPEGAAVNTLELDGTELKVDLNSAFRELILSQGTAGEWAVMGSVVNTFLTAYGAETMTITVDGEVLESGHVVYDMPLSLFS